MRQGPNWPLPAKLSADPRLPVTPTALIVVVLLCAEQASSAAIRYIALMKFLDEAKVYIRSGDGGNGCVSFRREKFIEFGGPERR